MGGLMDINFSLDKTSATYLGISIGAALFLGIVIGTLVAVVVSKRIA